MKLRMSAQAEEMTTPSAAAASSSFSRSAHWKPPRDRISMPWYPSAVIVSNFSCSASPGTRFSWADSRSSGTELEDNLKDTRVSRGK